MMSVLVDCLVGRGNGQWLVVEDEVDGDVETERGQISWTGRGSFDARSQDVLAPTATDDPGLVRHELF